MPGMKSIYNNITLNNSAEEKKKQKKTHTVTGLMCLDKTLGTGFNIKSVRYSTANVICALVARETFFLSFQLKILIRDTNLVNIFIFVIKKSFMRKSVKTGLIQVVIRVSLYFPI